MQTLTEASLEYAISTESRFQEQLDYAARFTARFNELQDLPAAQREVELLKLQIPQILLEPEPQDWFVGRVRYPIVGVGPEPIGLGYFFAAQTVREGAARYPQHAHAAQSLLKAWAGKTTAERTRSAYPPHVVQALPSDAWTTDSGIAFPLYRMAGTTLDYAKLLRLGLDGLEHEAQGTPFADHLSIVRLGIQHYLKIDPSPQRRARLQAILHAPPASFLEGIQLLWLYALISGTWSYGRLDITLGSLLSRDLDSGLLSESEALDALCSWWRLMHAYSNQYNNRLFIGGRGRPDEAAADRFALLAIEATRRVRLNQPQLSMRFYRGQNPLLWQRALDAIGEGCTFPMLYNDEVNIPAVAHAFNVTEEVATHYTPFGCGEYVLSHYGVGSPNGVINLLKALEVALRGGIDPITGCQVLPDLPPTAQLDSFEAVWKSYTAVVEHYVCALAEQQRIEYDVTAQEAPLGLLSLLLNDCIERKQSAFAGGVRYLGGTLETYGNTNTADSLLVIRELVFERKQVTLEQFVAALDADFIGHEALHQHCLAVAKYGNDEGVADDMAAQVHEHICRVTRDQAQRVGLHSYLVVIINNWANTILGTLTAASPDGRKRGQPMANANNPAPGADRQGVTAFLNSLTRLDPTLHAGAVQNMKFSKEWFGPSRPKLEALLGTYFDRGGTQAMITVVSPDDLRAAMQEPEKWGHLMVRVGGFSIRFVDLPRESQLEVLGRTLH